MAPTAPIPMPIPPARPMPRVPTPSPRMMIRRISRRSPFGASITTVAPGGTGGAGGAGGICATEITEPVIAAAVASNISFFMIQSPSKVSPGGESPTREGLYCTSIRPAVIDKFPQRPCKVSQSKACATDK